MMRYVFQVVLQEGEVVFYQSSDPGTTIAGIMHQHADSIDRINSCPEEQAMQKFGYDTLTKRVHQARP